MAAVSFVADDLTGAADVLAQAHRYGLDAVLVIGGGDTPLPIDADVVGIAGPARSLGGEAFDELVRAQLAQIAQAGADPARAVMVGDSRTDVNTARAAGIPVVCVPFGYTDVPVEALAPDLVIGHFGELPQAVRQLTNGKPALATHS